jgi:phage terminase small subunit
MDDANELEKQSLRYRFGLSERQERFVREYLVDLNATQAAKRAGYSTESRCAGSQIMSRPNVRQAIDAELETRSEQYRAEYDRIIQELAAVGFGQIADFVSMGADGHVSWTAFDELSRQKRAAVKKVKHTQHYSNKGEMVSESVELELESKLRALELLGKHIGMYRGVSPEDNRGAFAKWADEMRNQAREEDRAEGEGSADESEE